MMVIVDTNVAVVANGEWGEDFKDCEESCIDRLERIMRGEMKLVLDADWMILGEYSRNLHSRGVDVGDRFLVWCLRNRTNPERCELVSITPIEGSETEFKEFPDDPALRKFDPDDRKFIAVAVAHCEQPPILQAVDSQWWDFRDALGENEVQVEFICEDDIHRLRRAPESKT